MFFPPWIRVLLRISALIAQTLVDLPHPEKVRNFWDFMNSRFYATLKAREIRK